MSRISVKEAARRLEVTERFIRAGLRHERLPIGVAVQVSNERYTYHISQKLLDEYMGKEATA